MPIDYSKFDNIGSDDEEDDRSSGRGAVDFQQLLRQMQQAESSERSQADPGQLPDSYADPLMPFDDEFGGLDDGLGASRSLDFAGLKAEAWLALCNCLVTSPGPAEAAPRILLLEAEVHLLASRYRQALVAALAVQLASEGSAANCSPECPYGDWTCSTLVLEMVCSYQLGDRDHAVQLSEVLKAMDRSFLSAHLAKRFDGTCDVLELVPNLLNLIKASEQQESREQDSQ